MLRGLIRAADTAHLGQLPSPHAARVHKILAFDVRAFGRVDASNTPIGRMDARYTDALNNGHASVARALCEGGRGIDRVDASIVLHLKAREHVVGAAEREELLHLRW